jgi:sn-glycerol 3-phosphate transport system permease protein
VHPAAYATGLNLMAPSTGANFLAAWDAAPFPRYLPGSFLLVTLVLAAQFLLCTPAAYAFARLRFPGRDAVFALVLLQLMVAPDILRMANYTTVALLGLVDSIPGIALPYLGSPFGILLLRQAFCQIHKRWTTRRGSRAAPPPRAFCGYMCR